uniref:Heterokaryon incompatibility domain-containing protein n=1 Tax=Bionectria ochroleuca TaxID=29856 RepID=A0A8H7N8C9_BIOOC
MDFLEKIGRIMVCIGKPASISSSLWDVNIFKKLMAENPQISEAYLSSEEVEKTNEALRELTIREWWSRVWMVQVFVVAKDVVFQCGKKLSKLDVFETAVIEFMQHARDSSVLQTRGWMHLVGEYSYVPGRGVKEIPINRTFGLRHAYVDTQDPTRHTMGYLLKTLYRTAVNDREPKATDPRDKIYALLGLAGDSESLRIIPDYKKTVRDVYTEVVGKVIAKDGLSLLLTCRYNPSSGLPSWVPDFRQGLVMSPIDRVTLDKGFCAGSAGIVEIGAQPLDSNPNILCVKAYVLGGSQIPELPVKIG